MGKLTKQRFCVYYTLFWEYSMRPTTHLRSPSTSNAIWVHLWSVRWLWMSMPLFSSNAQPLNELFTQTSRVWTAQAAGEFVLSERVLNACFIPIKGFWEKKYKINRVRGKIMINYYQQRKSSGLWTIISRVNENGCFVANLILMRASVYSLIFVEHKSTSECTQTKINN